MLDEECWNVKESFSIFNTALIAWRKSGVEIGSGWCFAIREQDHYVSNQTNFGTHSKSLWRTRNTWVRGQSKYGFFWTVPSSAVSGTGLPSCHTHLQKRNRLQGILLSFVIGLVWYIYLILCVGLQQWIILWNCISLLWRDCDKLYEIHKKLGKSVFWSKRIDRLNLVILNSVMSQNVAKYYEL